MDAQPWRTCTHLTHGLPTRRPFHPAKTASANQQRELAQFITG
jgi:hypothetical protein